MYKRPEEVTNFNDVGDFHDRFGLPRFTGQGVQPFTKEMLGFRIQFLLEEVKEFIDACQGELDIDSRGKFQVIFGQSVSIDHAEAFDALIDLVYVAMGTAHFMRYPWQEGWNEVQRANMAKVRATSAEDSKRGTALDVVKPPSWRAPDIMAVLQRNGFPVYSYADEEEDTK